MVTVSFATNLRGSAGSAASLASASSAPLVIPSEARNLLFADRVAALPLSHAAPAPPAACHINSLRFITPPLCFSAPSPWLFGRPASPPGYHCSAGILFTLRLANGRLAAGPHHTPAANRCVIRHHPFPSDPRRMILLARTYHRNS